MKQISIRQVQDLKQHDCEKEIQEVNLRVTPARVATLKLFESHDKPVDVLHLTDHLQKDLGIDRVTVFRIINSFVEKGLLKKLEFQEGKARYELNKGEHHHLICQNCGKIEDVKDTVIPDFEKKIAKKYKFLVKSHSLEFYGFCNDCQK